MFEDAAAFNQDCHLGMCPMSQTWATWLVQLGAFISRWDISTVTDMSFMFQVINARISHLGMCPM
jgi:Mycoplasma protein of unknown function, DUF285